MNILPMEKKHIADVARLEKECFSEPWSEDGLSAELTKEEARQIAEAQGFVNARKKDSQFL